MQPAIPVGDVGPPLHGADLVLVVEVELEEGFALPVRLHGGAGGVALEDPDPVGRVEGGEDQEGVCDENVRIRWGEGE
jgi:hypothetical protein